MIYNVVGLVLALGVAAIAWRRSRAAGGFYDRDVYGMDADDASALRDRQLGVRRLLRGHVRIARAPAAGIAGLALYALVAVLYAASFLQGAPDPDE